MNETKECHELELEEIAVSLREARERAVPCAPVAEKLPTPQLASAYKVQDINVAHWSASAPQVGHKVGFASRLSQRQANLGEPLYGALLKDMAYCDGEELDVQRFCQPKVEIEIALVLEKDLTVESPTYSDIVSAVGFVLAAIEIVDVRYRDWVMTPVDAVADNTGAGGFVLGGAPRKLTQVCFEDLSASLTVDDAQVSHSGDPMFAAYPLSTAVWIAGHVIARGRQLKAGDVIMAGALGPPVAVGAGSKVSAAVNGLGTCSFEFSPLSDTAARM